MKPLDCTIGVAAAQATESQRDALTAMAAYSELGRMAGLQQLGDDEVVRAAAAAILKAKDVFRTSKREMLR